MIAVMHRLQGVIDKMQGAINKSGQVDYKLPIGSDLIELNQLIGGDIQMNYQGKISCMHCQRPTKKSFAQGFCYPCMQRLAQCDTCIMQPERCHYDNGTCREPQWGEQHCLIDHIVYLANSSGIKVGITRHTQIPTRWIDQGAIQAIPIVRVNQRKLSGLIELQLKSWISDKTNWRTMLSGEIDKLDLKREWQELKPKIADFCQQLQSQYGLQAVTLLDDEHGEYQQWQIDYPIDNYPTKVTSLGFDKHPSIAGQLQGIKGQYLILDSGVVNIRKHRGYHIQFSYTNSP